MRALRFWATHSPAAALAALAHDGDGFKLSDKVRLLPCQTSWSLSC